MEQTDNISEQLSRLHDAVLLTVELKWSAAQVDIFLRTANGPKRLTLLGVVRLECPLESPWGASECINVARLEAEGSAEVQMKLEMQSGDVISISARSVAVVASP